MDTIETINERVVRMIEREGLSVGSFAKKCGVPDSTIRSIVTTDRRPGYDLIVKMIEAIDRPWCDANWLVLGQAATSEDQEKRKEFYTQAIEAFDKAKDLDPNKQMVNWGYNRYQAYYALYGEEDARTKAAEADR